MNIERYEKIKKYMAENADEICRTLFDAVSMPSVRSESERKDEPFGHDCAHCLSECAKMFGREGFETEVFSEGGYALAHYGEGEKNIGLFAHTDVVPVNADEWIYTKPFEPKKFGDTLVGRGVSDNKAGVIASLFALRAMRDLGIKPKNRITVFLGSNEESGMADVQNFAREQKMPELSFVPDSGFPICLGQKGIFRFDVTAEKPFEDIVTMSGGSAYNIVCDKVTAEIKRTDALEKEMSAHPDFISVTVGTEFITVTATGKASHAAEAQNGINAMKLMSEYLVSLPSLCENDKKTLRFVSESLSDTYGTSMGIASSNDLFGALTASNGIVSLCDGMLEYTFDVRFGNVLTSAEIVSRIVKYFENGGFSYKKHSLSDCLALPEDSEVVRTYMDAYRALTGDNEAKAKPYIMGGGTYAYHLKNAYAVGFSVWKNSDMEFPEGHGGCHQPDEHISLSGICEGAALLCELVLCEDEIL